VSRRWCRSCTDTCAGQSRPHTRDAYRGWFSSSRRLHLREAKLYNLFSLVAGPGRGQHRMHPVADAKTFVGGRGQDRADRRTSVENDQAYREWRRRSLAAAILMEMHGSEGLERAKTGERGRFELIGQCAAGLASVVLWRKEHIAATLAAASVELRCAVGGVQCRLGQHLIWHNGP